MVLWKKLLNFLNLYLKRKSLRVSLKRKNILLKKLRIILKGFNSEARSLY